MPYTSQPLGTPDKAGTGPTCLLLASFDSTSSSNSQICIPSHPGSMIAQARERVCACVCVWGDLHLVPRNELLVVLGLWRVRDEWAQPPCT